VEYINGILTPLAQAWDIIFSVHIFLLMFAGISIGLIMGALPGFGSTVAFAVLLPFILEYDPSYGLVLLVSVNAVVHTGDTIPAVLMGIPGTAGSQATVVDGYPMALKGEAGRAFGAAFLCSAVGGVFGGLVLFFIIPVVRPIVLLLRSPHLFMLCLLGISMVSVLSGKRPLKGLAIGAVGLLLSAIGTVPGMAFVRYSFGQPFLETGVPLVIVSLGIFAIPELADLVIRGTQISRSYELGKGLVEGMKDVFRHWGIVMRCSVIGTVIGLIPGLGASVADWISYGHVVQFARDRSTFGKGDVRGVLAPESANNSKCGGSLIPTLFFGIPGSGSMSIFLGGLIMMGIYPGRSMVTENIHVVYYIVLTLIIASVLGTLICLAFTKWLALITTIKISYIAPFMILLVVTGAYQATRTWQDLVLLLGLGILGWLMKRFQWARPPLLIGFVLGNIAERYLSISLQRYGLAWVWDPIVILIGVVIGASLFMPMLLKRFERE